MRDPSRSTRFRQQVRRTQLIEVTIDLIARHGYAGTSLALIAEGAEISKTAVLYHFASKDMVVRAAYDSVIEALVAQVGAAVDAAPPGRSLASYVRAMVGYFRENPDHARAITEAAFGLGPVAADVDPRERWQPVADLIRADQAADAIREDIDPTVMAILVGGGLDAIVGHHMRDPNFNTESAAEALVNLVRVGIGLGTTA
jgi:TetR/AcrR family transcriptional regulator